MFESDVHTLTTPLGTLVFDRNAVTLPNAFIQAPVDDVANEREVVSYPEQDLAYVGDQYASARILTLSGVLQAASVEDYIPERQRIRGWVNQLRRADGLLQWTPPGMDPVQMVVRRHEKPDISPRARSGGMLLSLIAADPRVYSQAEIETEVTAPSATGGVKAPLVAPLVETQSGAPNTVTNEGDADAPPKVRIYGPITGPRLANLTTGLAVSLPGLVIASNDYVDIDMAVPSVLLNGSPLASRYSYVDPRTSTFWSVAPGDNAVALYGSNYTAGVTRAVVTHRHAWMP